MFDQTQPYKENFNNILFTVATLLKGKYSNTFIYFKV